MFDFFAKFFDTSDFPDRWHCGQWSEFHGWLHIISDLAVFGADLTIPFVMLYFLQRRSDIPFPRIFFLFAAFIFACGTVHLVEATIFWWPIYRISGTFKLLTALVSWATVVGLVRVLPAAITMRSAAELEAEAAKRKGAELRFRALLESAPDAVVIMAEDGNITLINRQTEKLFGYTKEEVLGQPFEVLISENHRVKHPRLREDYARNPGSRAMDEGRELYGLRKDGTEFPIEISLSPIETAEGRLISSAIRDVSERIKFQRILAQEKAKFEAIVNGIPDALVLADIDRNITYCNPAVEQVFGYKSEELIGQSKNLLYVNPEQHRRHVTQRSRMDAEEQRKPFEVNLKRKDGSPFPGENIGTIIRGPDGESLGYLGLIRDITDRKEAEKSLRIQERALQSAVNGIIITDPNQQHNPIVYVNKAAQMITGFSAEEMLGKNCRFLQNDDREQEALIDIRHAIEEERECKVELRNYRKDGTPFWNELIISPVRDEQGALTHFVGIQTDITERRKTAEDLQKSEQRFAAFMDNGPFIAWVKDSKGRHEYFNGPYQKRIGTPDDDWRGKTDFELWPSEVAESHREMDVKVLKTGKPISFESNHPLPKGETRSWYVVKFPFNIQGDGLFVGGIAVDITEQRRAESERDRFFDTSSELMCIADFQGHFKRVNQAFTDVLGFSRDELLAKPYVEFIHPSDVHSTETAVGQVIAGGSWKQFENRFRCKDGSYRLISWTTAASEPDANVMYAAGRDVTEQRSLERSLLQIVDNEQRRIAHDLHDGLGQELAGVSMMAESLANSLKAKALPDAKLANTIAVQLDASLQLTRSLARGLRPVEIDTQGLESALSQLANQTSEVYGIECSFDCNGDVNLYDPESATHLYRIAQEAVTNATKHGKPTKVEIHLSESNGALELKVIDDGIGIKHLPELQEGIGMKSMSYRCDMIGGKLLVESGESGGTIVACRLAAF